MCNLEFNALEGVALAFTPHPCGSPIHLQVGSQVTGLDLYGRPFSFHNLSEDSLRIQLLTDSTQPLLGKVLHV